MIKKLSLHWPSFFAIILEYFICTVCIAFTLIYWNVFTVIPCVLIVSSRQHALFILYHDAVHFLISRNKRLNDLITNLFIGVPMLLPVHIYRSLHLSHHKQLGTDKDPEKLLLYRGQNWNYRPLPFIYLVFQMLGDLLMYNNLKSIWYYLKEKNNPDSTLELPKTKIYPELYLLFLLFVSGVVLILLVQPALFGQLCLLWLLPLYTFTQLLQKIRSFAEHTGEVKEDTSGSWKPSLIGKLTIWPYNINYHREHHYKPGIPWDELPDHFPEIVQRPGSELWQHICNGKTV